MIVEICMAHCDPIAEEVHRKFLKFVRYLTGLRDAMTLTPLQTEIP
jgi:hypothetical protein